MEYLVGESRMSAGREEWHLEKCGGHWTYIVVVSFVFYCCPQILPVYTTVDKQWWCHVVLYIYCIYT